MIVAVYLSAVLSCTVYAIVLAAIRRTPYNYEPNYTWLTVVVGNALLGFHYWWGQVVEPVSGTDAFLRLFFINVAGGAPVIIWQLIEIIQRTHARRGYQNGTVETRRARVD